MSVEHGGGEGVREDKKTHGNSHQVLIIIATCVFYHEEVGIDLWALMGHTFWDDSAGGRKFNGLWGREFEFQLELRSIVIAISGNCSKETRRGWSLQSVVESWGCPILLHGKISRFSICGDASFGTGPTF